MQIVYFIIYTIVFAISALSSNGLGLKMHYLQQSNMLLEESILDNNLNNGLQFFYYQPHYLK